MKVLQRRAAADLIDDIREIMAERDAYLQDLTCTEVERTLFFAECATRIAGLLTANGIAPLTPCTGQAHGPEGAYIDNCSLCAPRWGWVGDKLRI